MRRLQAAIVIALVATVATAAAAQADNKKRTTKARASATSAAAARSIECLKEHGATYDPTTKQWGVMFREGEAGTLGIAESIRQCVASRGGTPLNLRERRLGPG